MKNKEVSHNINTFGYCGEVTTSVMCDNEILFTKTFHNNGYKTLFRFLCECIAGDYDDAEQFRPVRVKVFHYDENISPKEARSNFAGHDFEANNEALSGAINIDTRPKIEEDTEHSTYTAILHFNVPFTYLSNKNKDVNLIMLYASSKGSMSNNSANTVRRNAKGLEAYYLFTKNTDGVEEWDPIKVSEISSKENTNLIIEWKMSIRNID